jgi:hypothetical protein
VEANTRVAKGTLAEAAVEASGDDKLKLGFLQIFCSNVRVIAFASDACEINPTHK